MPSSRRKDLDAWCRVLGSMVDLLEVSHAHCGRSFEVTAKAKTTHEGVQVHICYALGGSTKDTQMQAD